MEINIKGFYIPMGKLKREGFDPSIYEYKAELIKKKDDGNFTFVKNVFVASDDFVFIVNKDKSGIILIKLDENLDWKIRRVSESHQENLN